MTMETPSVLCSRGDLLAWARRLDAKDSSPLVRFTADVSTQPTEGALDGHQKSAMEVLAAPSTALFACLSAKDEVTLWEFHSSGNGYVGVWPEGDDVRVNGPISASALGGYFSDLVGAGPSAADLIEEGLSLAAIGVFAAVVDAWAQTDGSGTIAGSIGPVGVTRDQIRAAAQDGLSGTDIQLMTSVVHASIPQMTREVAQEVDLGIAELISRALLDDLGVAVTPIGLLGEVVALPRHSAVLALDRGDWQIVAAELESRVLVTTCGVRSGWLGLIGPDRFAETLVAALG